MSGLAAMSLYAASTHQSVPTQTEAPAPSPMQGIDLRFISGSGYYVNPQSSLVGTDPNSTSVIVSGPVTLAGMNLEILDPFEYGPRCGFLVTEISCLDTQVMVVPWATAVNEAVTGKCLCVDKASIDNGENVLASSSEVPGFPRLPVGKNIGVYPTDPQLKVYRADGSVVAPENFKNLVIQDLGPGGRDEFGRPHRYIRFFKKTSSGGVSPISYNSDDIYLVLDGGPTPVSKSVASLVKVQNLSRQEDGKSVQKNTVNGSMYFEHYYGETNRGRIFSMKDGEYLPINMYSYLLGSKRSRSIEGFVDIRRHPEGAQWSFAKVDRTLSSNQTLPRLAHAISDADVEEIVETQEPQSPQMPSTSQAPQLPSHAAPQTSEVVEESPELRPTVDVNDAANELANMPRPARPTISAQGKLLYKPNGTLANKYENLQMEIVSRKPIVNADGTKSYLVHLWKPNEFGNIEPFAQASVYGAVLSDDEVRGHVPVVEKNLSGVTDIFSEIYAAPQVIVQGVHVPKDTPPSPRQKAMIIAAMNRSPTMNYCAEGVKRAMMHEKAYNVDHIRCDAYKFDTTYRFEENGFVKLDTINPYEAPPGAIIVYDSFAKVGSYKSRPVGRSEWNMRVDFPTNVSRKGYVPYYGHIEIKTDDPKFPFVSDHKQTRAVITHPTNKDLSIGWGFNSTKRREYKVIGIYYKR